MEAMTASQASEAGRLDVGASGDGRGHVQVAFG